MTHFFYTYGEYPAFILYGLAGITLFFSFFISHFKKWRRGALALVLTLTLGAGLIVNGILKEVWGRPRPSKSWSLEGPFLSVRFINLKFP